MNNEKIIEELVARVEALEAKVAALSKKVGVEEAEKGNRCMPGFNSCTL